jgi:microcystin-dependent protein
MSSPYVGECRLVGFNFAPVGWALCQGQLVPISENDTLFNLIGTTYGGDGQSTFQLPNLQGRAAVHQGTGFVIAQVGGQETVTLSVQQIPSHTHTLIGSNSSGGTNLLAGSLLASCPTQVYVQTGPSPSSALNVNSVSYTGNSQPHDNLQPYLTMSWIIALFGVYPSPT